MSIGRVLSWSWHHIVWLLSFSTLVALVYRYELISFSIPWLPVSVIGTAVAFYVGFKNNQAYDRMWEARKIWGAIVNSSRTWGMQVDGFVTNQFVEEAVSAEEIKAVKKELVYRHIGWLYKLRAQLLVPTSWEHISQKGPVSKAASYYQENYGMGMVREEEKGTELDNFVAVEEYERLSKHKNVATQLINEQSRSLTKLREKDLIDDFRHMEMAQVLADFYIHQGKAERIKKFPLPRQYANISRVFIGIFIFLLPFSMIPELMSLGNIGLWVSVPITALIGWVYVMMEVVGDYSENPFQGMANDIPMLSLSRVIETDLREMLEETDLPPAIPSKNGVLM